MKNYLLLTLLLLSTIGLSQKIPTTNQTVELEEPTTQTEITSIWGTINGDGPNTNPILDSLIEVNGLIVSNPLKNSRNKKLQSVYQLSLIHI